MTTPAKSASVRFGQTELSNRQLVLRLLRLAWRYRWGCLLVLLLQGVLLWTAVVAVQLSGIGIDLIRHHLDPSIEMPRLPWNVALPATSPMSQVAVVAGLVLLVAVVRAVMNYTHAVVAGDLVHRRIVVDLRAEVFDKMQHLSFRFFDANATGSLINRVTGDVQSLRSFIDAVLIQLILLAISLVVYLILLFRIHVGLTFACLATTPLMWLITVRFSKTVRPLYDFNRELNDRMILDLAENVQGVHVIKGFGLQHAEIAKFGNSNRQVQQQQQSIFWRVSLFSPTVQFMTQINLVILLIYGGYLVAQSRLELGTGLVVFAGLLQQFSSQVSNLAGLANSMQQSMTGARRVFEILDTPVEISNGPQPQPLEQVEGHIRFEHVWFAYADEEWVLQDVSFEVMPGESLAIVGETGAGKSTLLALIARFYDPQRGCILLDGVDLRELDIESLRRVIGVVFQESFLFSNSIAANIAFGCPDASSEQIRRAARVASAAEFVEALPEKYDTILGEFGLSLSGGQRQRLAVARAILHEPKILLLDDPAASLDPETESEIMTELQMAAAGRTSLLVAHRLSSIRRADRIVVLDRGRIVQVGSHQQLMEEANVYQQMAISQGYSREPSASRFDPVSSRSSSD